MVWFSKKSKAQMRARKLKQEKHMAENGERGEKSSTVKRKHTEEESDEISAIRDTPEPVIVTIPSNISAKESKKLRKEARRKTRREGKDENLLKFVDENGSSLTADEDVSKQENMESEIKEPVKKKLKRPKKTFPRINELLAEAEAAKKLQGEKEKQQIYEESIPADIRAQYVALDCEMVGIGTDGKRSALARVSITNWDGDVVLDTFVKVPARVTDFRTFVSGVRAKDIRSTNADAMELHACRRKVGELIKDKILIGHSLRNDFAALMLDHPKHQIRDTAKYKPFMRASGRNGGKLRPRKLRDLVKEHVGKTIQVEGEAHSSVDDANATLELYKTARNKWEKEIELKAAGKL